MSLPSHTRSSVRFNPDARRAIVCRLVLGLTVSVTLAFTPAGRNASAVATARLAYATYLGGTSGDPFVEPANAIAVDAQGYIYIAGATPADDFPTVNPFQANKRGGLTDAFVAKFTPDGQSLIYATYLGGSGNDEALGIAVDANGNAYVTGETASSNFPITNALQSTFGGGSDAFVTKLSSTGALLFSTYLGGVNIDAGQAIAVDTTGNVYVTGSTASLNFPTQNPIQGPSFAFNGASSDAFIAKLSADGQSLVYSTYFGGSAIENLTHSAIAVTTNGEVLAAGETRSGDLPTLNAAQATYGGGVSDAFVARINAAGSALVYSTYLGGSGDDTALGVTFGDDTSAYIAGETGSSNFPTLDAYQSTYGGFISDAFVTRLRPDGSIAFSTFLGGNNSDSASDIALSGAGEVYVTGSTGSANFPIMRPITPTRNIIGAKAFVTRFAADGRVLRDSNVLGAGQGLGIAWQAGHAFVSGQTGDPQFPVREPYQATLRGRSDAFVVKIADDDRLFIPIVVK